MIHRRATRRQRGFTLLETAFAVTLISLVFLGVMTLYAAVCRGTTRTLAQVDATAKAANAVQGVTASFREASAVALPGEAAFTPNGAFNAANCTTTYAGQTINTAALLTYPGAGSISVYYGGQTQPAATYDRTVTTTTTLLIYRANADGTPNPSGGQYLCQTTAGTGTATRLCTLSDASTVAAATADAVQFTRTGANQVEFRVIVNNYSPVGGQQGSESPQTPLTARCVLLRNHA